MAMQSAIRMSGLSPTEGLCTGTCQAAEELTEGPPNGKDGQKPLVRGWDELYCNYVSEHQGADSLRLPRKIAESTGRLPPTPMLHTETNEQRAM